MRYKSAITIFIVTAFIISCSDQESEKIKIKFWTFGAEGEYVNRLIPEFEENNPEIEIELQTIPWTAAQEKLITAYASENLPDVFQLGNTWVPQFEALEAIENLDKFIDSSSMISEQNYFEGIWETNKIGASVFGVPWYIDTRILFYRKDYLESVGYSASPKNWDELYDVSKKIRRKYKAENTYPIFLPTNEWATFIIFGLQNESELLKENNSYGNFESAQFEEAFNYLVKFYKEDLAPKGFLQFTNIYQSFADGDIAMYISGPWNVGEFKKWMTGDLRDDWMTAPLPGPDSAGVSLAGGSSLVIAKTSVNKKAAWKFIEFLSQPKTQIKFYKLIYNLPAVKSAWEDSILTNDKYMCAFYDQFQNVVPMPKIPEWEQIVFSKVQQYAETAARGVLSTEEALKRLDKDVNKILEKRRWLLAKKNEE